MQYLYPLRQVLRSVAKEIAAASREGVEVAVVVGGGNFFRGINAWDGLERATADYMGMLATCMNAICLQVAPATPSTFFEVARSMSKSAPLITHMFRVVRVGAPTFASGSRPRWSPGET